MMLFLCGRRRKELKLKPNNDNNFPDSWELVSIDKNGQRTFIVPIQENKDKPEKELNPDDYLYLDGEEEVEVKKNGKYSWEDEEDEIARKGCLCRYCKYFKCE